MEYNESWGGSIEEQNQASYVNWRFDLTHENDTQVVRIPEMGFGWKVWSTCWFDGDSWGGDDFPIEEGIDSCLTVLDNGSESSNGLLSVPYGGVMLAILSIGTAALMTRRT